VSTSNGSQRLLLGYFPIACGAKKSPTPVGTTRISVVQRHPSWRDPKTGKVYGPHDKKNVLGGYWLGLDAKLLGKKGYGIHGYSGAPPEKWIGKAVSNGCVRMLKDDIDRVFRVAQVGTKVRIE
jgi:L,D-transpeptidase ErfK/SrfK